jgi:hypothetical protein
MLASVGFAALGLAYGCSAGGAAFDDDDDDDDDGQGGSGGSLFITGGNGTGNGDACQDPMCIGATPQGNCDSSLAIDSSDAMDGARAIGICQQASGGTWGVTSAEWVRSDGQPLTGELAVGKGILSNFGPMQPRDGSKMLALSSGAARGPNDPGFQDPGGYNKDPSPHGAPSGYPKESPSCPGITTGEPYDSAGLRLTILTPIDAKSFTFDFDFYTYEYPDYICSEFNDFFVALLSPVPTGVDPDGNISFDAQGNNISVNAGFLQVCTASNAGGKNFPCPLGYSEINGTGFDSNIMNMMFIPGSAATSWLVTTAPIEAPGSEITLHFAIWDSGDGVLDSTVLVDNFRFDLEEGVVGTVPIY